MCVRVELNSDNVRGECVHAVCGSVEDGQLRGEKEACSCFECVYVCVLV